MLQETKGYDEETRVVCEHVLRDEETNRETFIRVHSRIILLLLVADEQASSRVEMEQVVSDETTLHIEDRCHPHSQSMVIHESVVPYHQPHQPTTCLVTSEDLN